jgi:dihydropyrimidinase
MTKVLLAGGTITTATGSFPADVLIDDGKITALGAALDVADAERVDVSGRQLLPGGVDVHTHLDAPFMGTITADDFESGTIAAAFGGTTTLIDFAMQSRGQKLGDTLLQWQQKAESHALIDYGFHLAITDLYQGALADMGALVSSGVTSFKIFTAYKGQIMLHDGEVYQVIRQAGRLGATVCIHAENGDVIDVLAAELVAAGQTGPKFHEVSRPAATEIEAVRRCIAIARMAEGPIYFVHLSTRQAAEAVAEARGQGWPVAGETCTHYLLLGPEEYDKPEFEGAKVVLTPPLRDEHERDGLWHGLRTRALSVVSSDHCPFCFVGQKDMGMDDFRKIPNGGPGIEHRIPLLYGHGVRDGRLSLELFVDLVATAPAKLFGLYPRKGTIQVGSDADIVVLNPDGETRISAQTQHQKLDYTPYEGWTIPGRIERVYSRGELIIQGDQLLAKPGRGGFLRRAPL